MKKINSSNLYKGLLVVLGTLFITSMLVVAARSAVNTKGFTALNDLQGEFFDTEQFYEMVEADIDEALNAETSVKYFDPDDQTISMKEFLQLQGGYVSLVNELGDEYLEIRKDILYEWACDAVSDDVQDTVYEYYDREHSKYYLSDTYHGESFLYRMEQKDDGVLFPFTEIVSTDSHGKQVSNADGLALGTMYYIENVDLKGIYTTKFSDGRSIVEKTNQAPDNAAYYNFTESLKIVLPKYKELYEANRIADNLDKVQKNFRWLIVDTNSAFLYTNFEPYCDYGRAMEYVDQVRAQDKYFVYEQNGCDSNISIDFAEKMKKHLGDAFGEQLYGLIVCGFYEFPTIADEYAAAQTVFDEAWIEKDHLEDSLTGLGIGLAIILILMTISAGHVKGAEGITLSSFDNIPTLLAAAIVILPETAISLLVTSLIFHNRIYLIAGATTAVMILFGILSSLLFFLGYNSFVKRAKADTLFKNSVIAWAARGTAELCRRIAKAVPGRVLGAICFGVTMLVNVIAMIVDNWGWMASVAIILDIALIVYVIYYISSIETVKNMLDGMKEGKKVEANTKKMPADPRYIGECVSNMQEMVSAAVSKSLSDEKMKVDLITNVSHDLKTPLTSIITYIDLLKKEVKGNEKAEEYVGVLEQKSARLKQLTDDVVEASKVSSGNIQVEKTVLDFVEIVNQVEGETKEKFEKANVAVFDTIPEPPVRVLTDGRHLYRVLENLYNNAAKYAMPGTRVYVSLENVSGEAHFTIKNISKEPLSIKPEELTERFVRGDSSRNTEGSGLGLSIAASLTENLGGSFKITIDGDLFRVDVVIPAMQ